MKPELSDYTIKENGEIFHKSGVVMYGVYTKFTDEGIKELASMPIKMQNDLINCSWEDGELLFIGVDDD